MSRRLIVYDFPGQIYRRSELKSVRIGSAVAADLSDAAQFKAEMETDNTALSFLPRSEKIKRATEPDKGQ